MKAMTAQQDQLKNSLALQEAQQRQAQASLQKQMAAMMKIQKAIALQKSGLVHLATTDDDSDGDDKASDEDSGSSSSSSSSSDSSSSSGSSSGGGGEEEDESMEGRKFDRLSRDKKLRVVREFIAKTFGEEKKKDGDSDDDDDDSDDSDDSDNLLQLTPMEELKYKDLMASRDELKRMNAKLVEIVKETTAQAAASKAALIRVKAELMKAHEHHDLGSTPAERAQVREVMRLDHDAEEKRALAQVRSRKVDRRLNKELQADREDTILEGMVDNRHKTLAETRPDLDPIGAAVAKVHVSKQAQTIEEEVNGSDSASRITSSELMEGR